LFCLPVKVLKEIINSDFPFKYTQPNILMPLGNFLDLPVAVISVPARDKKNRD